MKDTRSIGNPDAPFLQIHPDPSLRAWIRHGHPLRHHRLILFDTNVWINICQSEVIRECALDLYNFDQQQIVLVPPLQLAELDFVAKNAKKDELTRSAAARALKLVAKCTSTLFLKPLQEIILAEYRDRDVRPPQFSPLLEGERESSLRKELLNWVPESVCVGYDLEEQKVASGKRERELMQEGEELQAKRRGLIAPLRPFDFFGGEGRNRTIASLPLNEQAAQSMLDKPPPSFLISARVDAAVQAAIARMFTHKSRRQKRNVLAPIVDLEYCKYSNYFDYFVTSDSKLHAFVQRSDLPMMCVLDSEPSLASRIWLFLVDESNINPELQKQNL